MNRAVNLGLAFVLELAALAALCWWGFDLSGATWVKLVVGIGAPIAAVIVWSLFAAPRARYRLPIAMKLVVKAIVFGAAAAALIADGELVLGILFAVLVVANTALIRIGNLDEGIVQ